MMSKITRADLVEEVAVLKASNVALLSFADGAAVMARTEGKPNVREWELESAVLLHESISRAEQTIRQLENLIKKMDELALIGGGEQQQGQMINRMEGTGDDSRAPPRGELSHAEEQGAAPADLLAKEDDRENDCG